MRITLASGLAVEYDDAGQGPVVVLLHAFPLSRAMWRPQIEALRDRYRILAPDLRGFGGTGPFDGPPSIAQMADDVAGLLDALPIRGPVVLGGLSMGGYVALAFARRQAGRLHGLILADTKAEADSAEAKANRDRMIAFAQAHPVGDVLEQLLPRLLGEQTRASRPEVVEEVRRIALAQSSTGIVAALAALRDRPDATAGLGAIARPTLVVVGSEDVLTPPSVAQAMAAAIRGARLSLISGAGHLANLERPDAFNVAVRGFLDSLPVLPTD
jgi:pimeloyl-ACP methyl ester carboxylesterase